MGVAVYTDLIIIDSGSAQRKGLRIHQVAPRPGPALHRGPLASTPPSSRAPGKVVTCRPLTVAVLVRAPVNGRPLPQPSPEPLALRVSGSSACALPRSLLRCFSIPWSSRDPRPPALRTSARRRHRTLTAPNDAPWFPIRQPESARRNGPDLRTASSRSLFSLQGGLRWP